MVHTKTKLYCLFWFGLVRSGSTLLNMPNFINIRYKRNRFSSSKFSGNQIPKHETMWCPFNNALSESP